MWFHSLSRVAPPSEKMAGVMFTRTPLSSRSMKVSSRDFFTSSATRLIARSRSHTSQSAAPGARCDCHWYFHCLEVRCQGRKCNADEALNILCNPLQGAYRDAIQSHRATDPHAPGGLRGAGRVALSAASPDQPA